MKLLNVLIHLLVVLKFRFDLFPFRFQRLPGLPAYLASGDCRKNQICEGIEQAQVKCNSLPRASSKKKNHSRRIFHRRKPTCLLWFQQL